MVIHWYLDTDWCIDPCLFIRSTKTLHWEKENKIYHSTDMTQFAFSYIRQISHAYNETFLY